MKVKCQWITCKYNSKSNTNGEITTGDCEYKGEILLESDLECLECHQGIDGLICNTYIAKKYEDYK